MNNKEHLEECPLCSKKIETGERYYTDSIGMPMCGYCFKFVHPSKYQELKEKDTKIKNDRYKI